jgi:hypothetical protein
MLASIKGIAQACARANITAWPHRRTVATFRNIQQIRGSYNGIVIMQTTKAQYRQQRRRYICIAYQISNADQTARNDKDALCDK